MSDIASVPTPRRVTGAGGDWNLISLVSVLVLGFYNNLRLLFLSDIFFHLGCVSAPALQTMRWHVPRIF